MSIHYSFFWTAPNSNSFTELPVPSPQETGAAMITLQTIASMNDDGPPHVSDLDDKTYERIRVSVRRKMGSIESTCAFGEASQRSKSGSAYVVARLDDVCVSLDCANARRSLEAYSRVRCQDGDTCASNC